MSQKIPIKTDRFQVQMMLATILAMILLFLYLPCLAYAFETEDFEKPKPEFTQKDGTIVANLIPRAKSSSVDIEFKADDARLVSVTGVDFATADHPEVDSKNFKSALFEIKVDTTSPGDTAHISISSDFFTSSTAFYVYNEKSQPPWSNPEIKNIERPKRVREMIVTVTDRGKLDSDNQKNGQIVLIGGPRDSFWGYALGTLFIRFFGIFIVLTILMIGMICSGLFFQNLENRKKKSEERQMQDTQTGADSNKTGPSETAVLSVSCPLQPSLETVAAIGAALHLQLTGLSLHKPSLSSSCEPGSWVKDGRNRIMQDRLRLFLRQK